MQLLKKYLNTKATGIQNNCVVKAEI